MKINLKNKKLELVINSYGAYVEEFSYDKNPIFFPKLLFKISGELKTRGGMHPCLPNFGKSDLVDIDQHGYARTSFWQLIENDEKSVLLTLSGKKEFENLESFIRYFIDEENFYIRLYMRNKGKEKIPIAPGFHPYFYIGKDFEIKGLSLDGKNLENTIFIDRENIEFKTKFNKVKITSKELRDYAIWSDFRGDYICIEPTLNGPSFTKEINSPLYLLSKKDFTAEIKISVF